MPGKRLFATLIFIFLLGDSHTPRSRLRGVHRGGGTYPFPKFLDLHDSTKVGYIWAPTSSPFAELYQGMTTSPYSHRWWGQILLVAELRPSREKGFTLAGDRAVALVCPAVTV